MEILSTILKTDIYSKKNIITTAAKQAFPYTLPILGGFLFLGIAYGIFMRVSGFSPIYPILMALFIFAGSMEFVTVGLLLSTFDPIYALFMTIMVNGRHAFYGISMLDKYRNTGRKKLFLVSGLVDESFAINYITDIPKDVDKGWFMFFVSLYNYIYWVGSVAIGALFGSFISFNMEGLDFVVTALFLVIFVSQWQTESSHKSSILGLVLSILCLLIFGEKYFLLPAMCVIGIILTIGRKNLEKRACSQ